MEVVGRGSWGDFGSELMWRSLEPVIPIIEGGGRRYQVAEGDLDRSTRRRLSGP